MYYVTIDCGTTNSRVYVVDETGTVCGKATKKVGVRDTAVAGTKKVLEDGLRETIAAAIQNASLQTADIQAIFSSGMITSEIGLAEIPHLTAPCDVTRLSKHLTRVDGLHLIANRDIPVYFVRGIKNQMSDVIENPFSEVGKADFMRGEETQVAGLLAREDFSLPATVVVLSSHTKFIPVDNNGQILGSLTTLSGQAYEAIMSKTFVGKSVEKREHTEEKPDSYFDENIVKEAVFWIDQVGLIRSLMFPRFLEVLLDSKWYERGLFFEALIAAEDMKSVGQMNIFCKDVPKHFVLIGLPERCRLYRFVLEQTIPDLTITTISSTSEVDSLSINGIIHIARKAGIIS